MKKLFKISKDLFRKLSFKVDVKVEPMQLKDNEYRCEMCLNVYEKGWSDEESLKEAEVIWGKHPRDWVDQCSIVCDDCFIRIHPLKSQHLPLTLQARSEI